MPNPPATLTHLITLGPLLRQEAERLHRERPEGSPHLWPMNDHTTEWMEDVYGLSTLIAKVEPAINRLQAALLRMDRQRRRREGE
jgi:hypothetical protein